MSVKNLKLQDIILIPNEPKFGPFAQQKTIIIIIIHSSIVQTAYPHEGSHNNNTKFKSLKTNLSSARCSTIIMNEKQY